MHKHTDDVYSDDALLRANTNSVKASGHVYLFYLMEMASVICHPGFNFTLLY